MQRAITTLLGVATLCFAAAGAQAMSHEQDGEKNKEMWSKLDADGNGAVSRQEYTDALSKHFDQADTDSNGQISQEEWQARKEAMRSQMHEDGPGAE